MRPSKKKPSKKPITNQRESLREQTKSMQKKREQKKIYWGQSNIFITLKKSTIKGKKGENWEKRQANKQESQKRFSILADKVKRHISSQLKKYPIPSYKINNNFKPQLIQGLTQFRISLFDIQEYKPKPFYNKEEPIVCFVCNIVIKIGQKVMIPPCRHILHYDCGLDHFTDSTFCPLEGCLRYTN